MESIDVRATVRRHLLAGASLLIGLGVTVALSLSQVEVGAGTASLILLIATLQALVIALVLMHLVHERWLLVGMLLFTMAHLIAVLVIPVLGHFDRARF